MDVNIVGQPFWTIQGEGHLTGHQMTFIRLAGCSVGCPQCDTDYARTGRVGPEALADLADEVTPDGCRDRWVWLTGGEPLDQNLRLLIRALHRRRFSVALATSGHKRAIDPVDWLSVSPHDDGKWVQRFGDECKIIPGLNGAEFDDFDFSRSDFLYYYAQPLWGSEDSRSQCLAWARSHPSWLLTEQLHKTWGVP
jgi:7-carboxy-7-deazaguanine synthase